MTNDTTPETNPTEDRLKKLEANVFALAQMSQSLGQRARTDRQVLESIEAKLNSLTELVVKQDSQAPSKPQG